MRYDAPFLVKRFAPTMGRRDLPARISVAHQAYTLTEALLWARWHHEDTPKWIERRHAPASVPLRMRNRT